MSAARPVDSSPQVRIYDITAVTSNVKGAGTSNKVFITVVGEDGSTAELPLAHPRKSTKFRQGATDRFTLAAGDVGALQQILVRCAGSGITPVDGAWHLKRIEIRSAPIETPKKKTKAVVFVANDWVDIEGVTLSAIGISIPVKRDAVSPVSGRSTPANRLSPDHLPSGDQSPAQTPQRVPSWDHITAQSLSTLQEYLKEYRVAETIEKAYVKIFARGMVVSYNPHSELLDDFMNLAVLEDLNTAPAMSLLIDKAFPIPHASERPNLIGGDISQTVARGKDKTRKYQIQYTKVLDVSGNFAYANPFFPMSADLQACSFYRRVYQELAENVIDYRSGIHTWGTFSSDGAACLTKGIAPFRASPIVTVCFYMQSEYSKRMEHIVSSHVERCIGFLESNRTEHELLSASYCAASGGVYRIPLRDKSEAASTTVKFAADVAASRGSIRFTILFSVDEEGQNREPPYTEVGHLEFTAIIYDAHSATATVGSRPPAHPLGYQSLVFFTEADAKAYEQVASTGATALFAPPYTSPHPPPADLGHDGSELAYEHAQCHRWRIAMADCLSEFMSCAHHALRSTAPFVVALQPRNRQPQPSDSHANAAGIVAETFRLSRSCLGLFTSASACCTAIVDSASQVSATTRVLLTDSHVTNTVTLIRDLKLILGKLAISDAARAFLTPEKLLAEIDGRAWEEDVRALVELATSAIPRIKGVVDFARLEYAELALRNHCPALLQYFNACKQEYGQPLVFSAVDELAAREERFPETHGIASSMGIDTIGRKYRRQKAPVKPQDPKMLDLKHGHEDELEMNLHRDLSFDLRLCSEFDKLSCAIQNQATRLQYAVDTDLDKVLTDWVTELSNRRPLSQVPSAVACRLLHKAMWDIDDATRQQFVNCIRDDPQLFVPVDSKRRIVAVPSTETGPVLFGAKSALRGTSVSSCAEILELIQWTAAATIDPKEPFRVTVGCFGPATMYGSVLCHLHSVRLVEAYVYGGDVSKAADSFQRTKDVVNELNTTSRIPDFAAQVVSDIARQYRESVPGKYMVSHVKVGGNRFGTKRIFSERESVLDDIRYAVETGGELTVHYFVRVDGWRMIPVTKHVQYVEFIEAGTFAQMRPLWIREQDIAFDSYVSSLHTAIDSLGFVFLSMDMARIMYDAYEDCGLPQTASRESALPMIRTDDPSVSELLGVFTVEVLVSLSSEQSRAAELMRGPFEIVAYVASLLESVQDLLRISADSTEKSHQDPRQLKDNPLHRVLSLMVHAALFKFVEMCSDVPVLRVPVSLQSQWTMEATAAVERLLEMGPAFVVSFETKSALKAAYRRTRTVLHVAWNSIVVGDRLSYDTEFTLDSTIESRA